MISQVDLKRCCLKCGGDAIARYRPAKSARGYWDYKADWPDEEFIERICQTCGYAWHEACLRSDPS
jgi:hypothetical protein